jgi:hypothetical protein
VWGLLFDEQINPFRQIYCAPIGKVFDALKHVKVFNILDL